MSQTKREQLHSQTNVNETQANSLHSSETIIERAQIPGTPYWIIHNDNGYMVTFSKWQMTKYFKTEDELLKFMDDELVNMILQTILCIVDPKEEVKQLVKKIKTDLEK